MTVAQGSIDASKCAGVLAATPEICIFLENAVGDLDHTTPPGNALPLAATSLPHIAVDTVRHTDSVAQSPLLRADKASGEDFMIKLAFL